MDPADRHAIDALFDKLDGVERQGAPRDPEAERYIADQIARRPGASYYLAQTVIMQEQALHAAEQRMQAQPQKSGGLFSRLFDDGRGRPAPTSVPATRPYAPAPQPQGRGPWGGGDGYGQGQGQYAQGPGGMMQQRRGGNGFLAGAAQTAMGVAGGVVLGSMLMNAFDGGGEAQAAEPEPDTGVDDVGGQDDFGGGDFGGGEF